MLESQEERLNMKKKKRKKTGFNLKGIVEEASTNGLAIDRNALLFSHPRYEPFIENKTNECLIILGVV